MSKKKILLAAALSAGLASTTREPRGEATPKHKSKTFKGQFELNKIMDEVSAHINKTGSTYKDEYDLILQKKSGLTVRQRAALVYVMEREILAMQKEHNAQQK